MESELETDIGGVFPNPGSEGEVQEQQIEVDQVDEIESKGPRTIWLNGNKFETNQVYYCCLVSNLLSSHNLFLLYSFHHNCGAQIDRHSCRATVAKARRTAAMKQTHP